MFVPSPGDKLEVTVTKVSLGKDGLVYVTVSHPQATNRPTFTIAKAG